MEKDADNDSFKQKADSLVRFYQERIPEHIFSELTPIKKFLTFHLAQKISERVKIVSTAKEIAGLSVKHAPKKRLDTDTYTKLLRSIDELGPLLCEFYGMLGDTERVESVIGTYYEYFEIDPLGSIDYFEGEKSILKQLENLNSTQFFDIEEDLQYYLKAITDYFFGKLGGYEDIRMDIKKLRNPIQVDFLEILDFILLGYEDAALWKTRKTLEKISRKLLENYDTSVDLNGLIEDLRKKNVIGKTEHKFFHYLRELGNEGTHYKPSPEYADHKFEDIMKMPLRYTISLASRLK